MMMASNQRFGVALLIVWVLTLAGHVQLALQLKDQFAHLYVGMV